MTPAMPPPYPTERLDSPQHFARLPYGMPPGRALSTTNASFPHYLPYPPQRPAYDLRHLPTPPCTNLPYPQSPPLLHEDRIPHVNPSPIHSPSPALRLSRPSIPPPCVSPTIYVSPYPDAGDFLRNEFQVPPDTPVNLYVLPDPLSNDVRPSYTLHTLATLAIYGNYAHKATLHEIRLAITQRFPFFGKNETKFNGSLRHLLSFHAMFAKIPRLVAEPGQGDYWTLDITHAYDTKRPRKRRTAKGKVTTSQSRVRPTGRASVYDEMIAKDDEAEWAASTSTSSVSSSTPPPPYSSSVRSLTDESGSPRDDGPVAPQICEHRSGGWARVYPDPPSPYVQPPGRHRHHRDTRRRGSPYPAGRQSE